MEDGYKRPFWQLVTILYTMDSGGWLEPVLLDGPIHTVIDRYTEEKKATGFMISSGFRHVGADDFLRLSPYHPAVQLLEPSIQNYQEGSWQRQFLAFLFDAREFEVRGFPTITKERRQMEEVRRNILDCAEMVNKYGDVELHPNGHLAVLQRTLQELADKIEQMICIRPVAV